MSANTKIEWADVTWNPVRGCSKVSEGCRNCYAEKMAARFSGPGQPFDGTITNGRWNGQIRLVSEVLNEPLRRRKPRRIFVNSMSDLFHENVPLKFIDEVFAIMALAKQHTFMILTKRPKRMKEYITYRAAKEFSYSRHIQWPLPNVWLGVSVENQRAADERIPLLLQTPAAVRFLSCEPLLGPVSLEINIPITGPGSPQPYAPSTGRRINALTGDVFEYDWHGRGVGRQGAKIDWVIVGGESGPNARPMHPDWVRGIRDQCVAAGVPFFFKQWGEWKETDFSESIKAPRIFINAEGNRVNHLLHDSLSFVHMVRVGKKDAGRLMDGRTWDELPVVNQ